jgi:hypothetical protein
VRTAAVRFVLTLLTGLLLAPLLPLSDTPVPEAHAFTREIQANGPPGTALEGMRGEYGTGGTPDRSGEPNRLLRNRDRHRPTVAPAPDAPSRSLVTTDGCGLLVPAAVAAMGNAHHTPRSSGAHSSPMLQVFLC